MIESEHQPCAGRPAQEPLRGRLSQRHSRYDRHCNLSGLKSFTLDLQSQFYTRGTLFQGDAITATFHALQRKIG